MCRQLEKGELVKSVGLQMSIIKPFGARWLIGLYDYMKLKPDIIIKKLEFFSNNY